MIELRLGMEQITHNETEEQKPEPEQKQKDIPKSVRIFSGLTLVLLFSGVLLAFIAYFLFFSGRQ